MNPSDKNIGKEHLAIAKAMNLPISTKQCVEISRSLRYKTTAYAKKFLEGVAVKKMAVPFVRATKDLGHKPGMSSGRFPQKAAKEFLKLIKSVEANAQFKGLNTSELKIVKILANKASIPQTGGRTSHNAKNSHLEIEVKELVSKKEVRKSEGKKAPDGKKASSPAPQSVHQHPVSPVHQPESKSSAPEKVQPIHKHTAPASVSSYSSPKVDSKESSFKPIQEPTSEELLKRAQERAAQLNQKGKEQADVNSVSNLYEELQKKGTLRGKK